MSIAVTHVSLLCNEGTFLWRLRLKLVEAEFEEDGLTSFLENEG